MISSHNNPTELARTQGGFTLIEIMIVVAIVAILAAFAYPNYQQYVIKTKRVDMMSELQNIATQLESRKLVQGSYGGISAGIVTEFARSYPRQGTALYTVSFTPNPLTSEWEVIATPKPGTQVATDGVLTLNYLGRKCRGTICGTNDKWKD